jgi:rare lipoprotein A
MYMLRQRRPTASFPRLLARAAVLAVLALGAPASALAQTPDPSGGVSPTPTQPTVQSGPAPETGNLMPAPVDLGGRIGAIVGMQVTIGGSLPAAAGRTVLVQREDPRQGWVPIATTTAAPDGSFSAVWTVDRIGVSATRAILSAPGAVQAASAQTQLTSITGYRAAKATYFGPGLFGRRTACGQRLTRRLRGIAHRTLPCGSTVELVYKGRILRAPVVDRGPFNRGIRYDLTQATARDLGFRATDVIGAALVASPRTSS